MKNGQVKLVGPLFMCIISFNENLLLMQKDIYGPLVLIAMKFRRCQWFDNCFNFLFLAKHDLIYPFYC